MKPDERLGYYVTVAGLLTGAGAQLAAGAEDVGSRSYAEELAALRAAVEAAGEAAVRIAANLAEVRIQGEAADPADDEAPPFH